MNPPRKSQKLPFFSSLLSGNFWTKSFFKVLHSHFLVVDFLEHLVKKNQQASFQIIQKQSQTKNPVANFLLSFLYFNAYGVQQDFSKSLVHAFIASFSLEPHSIWILSKLIKRGFHRRVSFTVVQILLNHSASFGDVSAMKLLSKIFIKPIFGFTSFSSSKFFSKLASEVGSPDDLISYANAVLSFRFPMNSETDFQFPNFLQCFFKFSFEQNRIQEALHSYQDAADSGNPHHKVRFAQTLLNRRFSSVSLINTRLTIHNPISDYIQVAKRYFENAVAQGGPVEQADYASALLDYHFGEPDLDFVLSLLKLASENGGSNEKLLFAQLIIKRIFPSIHLKEAYTLFKSAADFGSGYHKIRFANALLNGSFEFLNLDLAAQYYKLGADTGNGKNKLSYAKALISGVLGFFDRDAAETYFKEAIRVGGGFVKIEYANYLLENNFTEEAYHLYQLAADTGGSYNKIQFARSLLDGTFGFVDKSLSQFYFKLATDTSGFQQYYAHELLKGTFGKPNIQEINKLYEIGLHSEDDDTKVKYGESLISGLLGKVSEEKKYNAFKMAFESGDVDSKIACYKALKSGTFGDINDDDLLQMKKMIAEIGGGHLMVSYARKLIKFGRLDEAFCFYKYGSITGHTYEKKNFADALLSGVFGKPDIEQARLLYKLAADSGTPSDKFFYATQIREGRFGDPDEKEIFSYMKLAADLGPPRLKIQFGNFLVSKDQKLALKYFELACETFDPESMISFAKVLMSNSLGFVDQERAFSLFQLAARFPYPKAMLYFAESLLDRNRSLADASQASRYFHFASECSLIPSSKRENFYANQFRIRGFNE